MLREHGGRTASGIFDIVGSQACTSGSDLPLANDRLWPLAATQVIRGRMTATDPTVATLTGLSTSAKTPIDGVIISVIEPDPTCHRDPRMFLYFRLVAGLISAASIYFFLGIIFLSPTNEVSSSLEAACHVIFFLVAMAIAGLAFWDFQKSQPEAGEQEELSGN